MMSPLLPGRVDAAVKRLEDRMLFACTCGHERKNHMCECGVVSCAECPKGTVSVVRFFNGEQKQTCLGLAA